MKTFYVNITGGFGDNLRIYCIKYKYPQYKFKFVIDRKIYRAGYTNCNLQLFKFDDLIDKKKISKKITTYYLNNQQPKLPLKYELTYKLYTDYLKYFRPILFNPISSYSNTCKDICDYISNKDFILIGIRFRYPFTKRLHFFLYNAHETINNIENTLKKNTNFILMFDDWKYIQIFKLIFNDLLKNKNIITTRRINVNAIHELILINSLCKYSVHNHSSFYILLDTLRR